jgi:hypothetical protein
MFGEHLHEFVLLCTGSCHLVTACNPTMKLDMLLFHAFTKHKVISAAATAWRTIAQSLLLQESYIVQHANVHPD